MSDPRGRFFAWTRAHPSEAAALQDVPPDVLSSMWDAAWRGGGYAAMRDSARMVDLVPLLRDLLFLLQDEDVEQQAERELEASSAYWRKQ